MLLCDPQERVLKSRQSRQKWDIWSCYSFAFVSILNVVVDQNSDWYIGFLQNFYYCVRQGELSFKGTDESISKFFKNTSTNQINFWYKQKKISTQVTISKGCKRKVPFAQRPLVLVSVIDLGLSFLEMTRDAIELTVLAIITIHSVLQFIVLNVTT